MSFKDHYENLDEADMKYEALSMAKELHSQLANLTFITMLGVMNPDNPAKKEVQALETAINDLTNEVGEFIQKYIPDVAAAEAGDGSDVEPEEEEEEEEEKPAAKKDPKKKEDKVEEADEDQYSFSDFIVEAKIDTEIEAAMRKALKSKDNINKDKTINWNYVDADVYMDVNNKDQYNRNAFYKAFDRVAKKLTKELKLQEATLEIGDYVSIDERNLSITGNSCGDMRFGASKRFEQKEYSMAMSIMDKHQFSAEEVIRQFHHVKLEKLLQMIADKGIN